MGEVMPEIRLSAALSEEAIKLIADALAMQRRHSDEYVAWALRALDIIRAIDTERER
jgi:hypothetical protein